MSGCSELRHAAVKGDWRRCARRIAGVIVIAMILAGCDRCGDWVSPLGSTMSCRQEAPKPQ